MSAHFKQSIKYVVFSILLVLFFAPSVFANHLTVQQECDPSANHCAASLSCQQATVPQGSIQTGDYACFSSTTITPTPSQSPIINSNRQPISAQNYKAPQHANYSFINLEHTALCELVGTSPVSECVGLETGRDESGNLRSSLFLFDQVPGGGAMGGLSSVVVALYSNPPTSTARYLADLGENLGIKPAYAQVGGSGAGIIEPVKTLWQVVRNISYVTFIVVFIIIGLMIMLRARINPQTVISAQAALPGLVLGLILVTFSYFVAALLIDTAFVGIQLVAQIFISAGPNIFNPQAQAQNSNIFNLFTQSIRGETVTDILGGIVRTVFSTGGGGLGGAAVAIGIPAVIGAIVGTILFPGAGTLLGIGIGTAAGAGLGAAATGIVGLIIPLILIIALLIQFFRLLFGLIGSYIALLIATITGPFVILFSSIPGKSGALGLWWKSLLGNALVFPAVFAAFLFAGLILGTPIERWNIAPPLFGGLSPELLRLIIAYGIILGTPAIPGMVKKAMGVPELGEIPQAAIGGAFAGAIVGGATAPYGGRAAAAAGERLLRGPAAAARGGWQERLRQRLEQWSQPPRRP